MREPTAATLLLCILLVTSVFEGCRGVHEASTANSAPSAPGALVLRSEADPALVVPLLGELVRAAVEGASAVRRVAAEQLQSAGVPVAAGDRWLRAGSVQDGSMLYVVRLDIAAPSRDIGGVVVGEPPRLEGRFAHTLTPLALAVALLVAIENGAIENGAIENGSIGHGPLKHGAIGLVLIDDDDVVADALAGARPAHAWAPGPFILEAAERAGEDLAEVTVGCAGLVRLALTVAPRQVLLESVADDGPERLAIAVGRAVSWSSRPRMSAVMKDRSLRLAAARGGLESLWPRGLDALAADPHTRRSVVEGCLVQELSPTEATISCRVLPGHLPGDVRDAVLLEINDPHVEVRLLEARPPTNLYDAFAFDALQARLREELPQVVVVPTLDVDDRPVCRPLQELGVPCFGLVPLRLHRAERALSGRSDESVPVRELQAAFLRVFDVTLVLSTRQHRRANGAPQSPESP